MLLKSATNPARSLDGAVAEAIGWSRQVEKRRDSESGETIKTTIWFMADGRKAAKLPYYTANMQHAFDLAQQFAPDNFGGCSWEDGKGSARLNDGPYVQAATPQIALCIAVLLLLH
ncbi:hypothetical protein SAMN03159496_05564 [Rhizobium sp. NFR07]|nr:hypothetical protein SAMN03159496_05564 [Rhizobium sp. NFR07]